MSMSRGGLDLVALIRAVLEPELDARDKAISDGVVAQVAGNKASVQLGGPSAAALPGFVIPPSLVVLVGDHVQVYRQGGYQLVLEVLNRNALNVVAGTGGGSSGGGSPNLDGGLPDATYGGIAGLDGGAP